jgi:hypothetical protein
LTKTNGAQAPQQEIQMRIEIFYIGGKTGWAVAFYDAQRNQIGDSEFFYYKQQAKADAVSKALKASITEVCSYRADGERLADISVN